VALIVQDGRVQLKKKMFVLIFDLSQTLKKFLENAGENVMRKNVSYTKDKKNNDSAHFQTDKVIC
jgi:hypothetical protein